MRRWWHAAGFRESVAAPETPPPDPFVFTPFDVNHILGTGQSLSVGYGGTADSTTQPYSNIMLAYGVQAATGFSGAFIPLVESGPETMSSPMANLLTELAVIEGITPFVSLVSVHGAGGTPYSGLKKGTEFFTRAMDQVTGAASRATTNGQTYVVRAVTSVHGESDSIDDSLTYEADIIEWQVDYETDVQAITGQTLSIPMFHTQNSQQAESWIPLDMLAAHIAQPGKVILVGPKYHLQPYFDGTHLTTVGYQQLGEDYAKAYRKVILEGGVWEPLRPKTVSRVGALITIVFHVPVMPLALDTTLVASTANYGFDYVDNTTGRGAPAGGGQSPTVSSVAVTAADTVQITPTT